MLRLRPSLLLAALAVLALSLLGAVAHQQDLERARERWNDLPEERRRELVERYERWKSMPEAERARLRERFQQVDPMRRSAHECLSESARREFSRLSPEQQAEVRSGVASQQIHERGRELLERLPSHWRDQLESSTPEQRARLVEEFRSRMHAKALERVDQLAREGAIAAPEAERLRGASSEELARGLFEIEARRFRERLEREGPPSYVTPEQWAQWKDLPTPELWMRLHEAKRGSGSRGRPEFGEGHGEGRGDGRREGWSGPRPEKPETPAEARLRESLRPDPAWFVEFADRSFEERGTLLGARLRERALAVLDSEPSLVDAATLESLRQQQGLKFFEALTRAVPSLGGPWWSRERSSRGGSRGDSSGKPPGPPSGSAPGSHGGGDKSRGGKPPSRGGDARPR